MLFNDLSGEVEFSFSTSNATMSLSKINYIKLINKKNDCALKTAIVMSLDLCCRE